MTLVSNPPWLTNLVGDFWGVLEKKVPPGWFPKLSRVRPARGGRISAEMKEYGCGNYGCVLPTDDPAVVLKVTTDATEAHYAAYVAKTMPVEVTTRYLLAVELSAKHKGRKVSLLWRESATMVGKISGQSAKLVAEQHACATEILRELIAKDKTGKAVPMAGLTHRWTDSVERMARDPELAFVANGMLACVKEAGTFFLDVHVGNLGLVDRDNELLWVITDPGNVLHQGASGKLVAVYAD